MCIRDRPKMEENTPSFNHSENISSTPDEISNNPKNEKSKKRFILIISFVVVGIIAILIGIFLFLYFYKNNESSVVSESETVSDMQSMVESATIEVFTPYQLQIESLGALIYSGPGYEYAIVDSIHYMNAQELNMILRDEIAALLTENNSDDVDDFETPITKKPYVIMAVSYTHLDVYKRQAVHVALGNVFLADAGIQIDAFHIVMPFAMYVGIT